VWTYGIQLWGCAKPSYSKILQRFQSQTIRSFVNAPWYVSNRQLHNDSGIPFVADKIRKSSIRNHQRLAGHHDVLVAAMSTPPTVARRLKCPWPSNLQSKDSD
jgi:hypothetical protein